MNFLRPITEFVANAKDYAVDFMTEETTTTRKQTFTTCTIIALAGIIIGFVFSPIKKGFYFNISDNGNYAPENKPIDIEDTKKNKKEKKGKH